MMFPRKTKNFLIVSKRKKTRESKYTLTPYEDI